MTDSRICTKCRTEKPLEDFPKAKRCIEGRRPTCKTCINAVDRARYAADPDLRSKTRTYLRNYYATKPEHRQRLKDNSQAWQKDGRLPSLKKTRAVFHDDDKIRGPKHD